MSFCHLVAKIRECRVLCVARGVRVLGNRQLFEGEQIAKGRQLFFRDLCHTVFSFSLMPCQGAADQQWIHAYCCHNAARICKKGTAEAVPFDCLVGECVVAVHLTRHYDVGVTRVTLGDGFALLAHVARGLFFLLTLGATGYEQHASAQRKNGGKAKNTHFHIDPNPFKGFAFSVFIVTKSNNFVNSFLYFSKKRDINIFSPLRIYL